MRPSLALAAVLIVVTPASSEPTILVEIRQTGSTPRSVDQPIYLAFVAEKDSQSALGDMYDSADVGMTLDASPSVLAGIETAFTNGGRFWIDESFAAPPAFHVDLIWSLESGGWQITRNVPRLGLGLSGYDLTGVTQTIDALSYTNFGGQIWTQHVQTIRLFGEELPPLTPPLACDYNQDGTVNAADYVVWREFMVRNDTLPPDEQPILPNTLIGGPRPASEFDWFAWHHYFGESVPPLEGADAVPEPASWLLACLALCFVRRHR